MNDRQKFEFAQQHPHPGGDPVKRLRHTLDLYAGSEDDRMVLEATTNMYPQGPTGLTFGDLRALAKLVGA